MRCRPSQSFVKAGAAWPCLFRIARQVWKIKAEMPRCLESVEYFLLHLLAGRPCDGCRRPPRESPFNPNFLPAAVSWLRRNHAVLCSES